MDRREFFQSIALTTAAAQALPVAALAASEQSETPDTTGHTLQCEFQHNNTTWRVYEDLSKRDGSITFVPARGAARVMTKRLEACFSQVAAPFLGLSPQDIGTSLPDLLADKLLAGGGDPDELQVRDAAPLIGSPVAPNPNAGPGGGNAAGGGGTNSWNTFVGTKECFDTAPVYAGGNTRTYHPNQYFPELQSGGPAAPAPAGDRANLRERWEGLLGGWMPAVHKIFPINEKSYIDMVIFGDVKATDKFIVQTWHRTARIDNGKAVKTVYGYSYPAYPPFKVDPKAEEFYRALLVFAEYWDRQLADFAPTTLPDKTWVDMSKHAVAKEIMVRPGGVYPKYGAVDRDYYGSEYDGFQDIFTASVYTNLELGRFEPCKAILDNYLSEYTDAKGMINMRGPETAQYGLTLSLVARYLNYTKDAALIQKHRAKIEATAAGLLSMHDSSLKLPPEDRGYGLIAGWSESDSCLPARPEMQPRIEDVAEMTVSTAQLDLSGNGVSSMKISLVTRRGSNAFHGRVFEDFQNTALNANSWTNNARSLPRNIVKLNDFGGSVGGPILKNKLFFFGTYAQSIQPQSISTSASVLSAVAQSGVFQYKASNGSIQGVNVLQIGTGAGATGNVNSAIAAQLQQINGVLGNGVLSPTSDPNISTLNGQYAARRTIYYPAVRFDYT